MDRRLLFLSTLSDLERKILSEDPYELLRCSVLIRQLFLDGRNSLVDQVNREAGVKLRFTIVEPGQHPDEIAKSLTLHISPSGLDPDVCDLLPDAAPAKRVVNRDQFFAAYVGTVLGQRIIAHNVVDHVAFTMGGIHAGTPKREADATLAKMSASMSFFGVDPAIWIIRAIAKNCMRALAPLRHAVMTSLAKHDG